MGKLKSRMLHFVDLLNLIVQGIWTLITPGLVYFILFYFWVFLDFLGSVLGFFLGGVGSGVCVGPQPALFLFKNTFNHQVLGIQPKFFQSCITL